MNYEHILVEKEDGVGIVTLNRPEKLNAMNRTLSSELRDAVKAFDADDGIGCTVITGAGRAFSAGGDIHEQREDDRRMSDAEQDARRTRSSYEIAASAKPHAFILDPLWLSEEHDLVTPASLIAETEQEAEEMALAAPGSYSLRSLQSQVQVQREEAIRRRLEATASFREGKINWQLFAAATGEHRLVQYTPVYRWECLPPSRFTRGLLQRAGIDPETVPTEGLAREVMLAVGRRRYQGLAEIRHLAGPAAAQVPNFWHLRTEEARRYE